MATFKIDLEATADHKQSVKIPEELMEAYIMQRLGWSYQTLRATPSYLIEQITFIWHLQEIAEKSANREANKKPI